MTVVALGTFDGVHAGHRALFAQARTLAAARGEAFVIHTFANHPRGVYAQAPRLLMTDAARLALLASLGDEVVADEFTPAYAAASPEAFARMLRDKLRMTLAVTGENYTFGARGAGTVATLGALGETLGFASVVVPPCLYAGEIISSTRIREAVEAGRVAQAAQMLARPYALSGLVVKNRGIGGRHGFPTANIAFDPQLALPADGVYATLALLEGKTYPAVTNVGCNPTVNGDKLSVETHLLDFAGDIYGKPLEVRFVERLRGETRFADMEALRAQIRRDEAAARTLLCAP